jgi:diaminohydroxyphosphoribosylaminopyrimidine deaminase/5-amino-6-(5-phosphoribosylamino)uracil reductase
LNLNKIFFTFHNLKRPYIILKWAQSTDKKMASGTQNRLQISTEITNHLVHKWRTEEAAILVGTNTALKDNPLLTARLMPGNNPVRLVIDKDLKLPATLHLFDGTVKTIVFNCIKQEESGSVVYQKINREEKLIPQVLDTLYNLNIQSVIVEGGSVLLQSFIDEQLWDEARVITNTAMKITNGVAAPLLANNSLISTENVMTDKIEYFINNTL